MSQFTPESTVGKLSRFIWVVPCLALTLGAGLIAFERARSGGDAAAPAVRPPASPHVIFISLDTTRADYLGCYGNTWVKTPQLDAFAEESIVFDQCMAAAPTTLASHTSMFTGTYPHTHGCPRNGFFINNENVMLAELLRDAGYHTAGFPAAFPLNKRFNFAQGFAHYDDAYQEVRQRNQRSAEAETNAVLSYLKTHQGTKPLFLFAHYWDPHHPYDPPQAYAEPYLALASSPPQDSCMASTTNVKWRRSIARYAGEISYMDEHAGRLFAGLREQGILDRAVVVVTSDHGETLVSQKPYFSHGFDTFFATTHVVAMVRLPRGMNGGMRIAHPLSNVDLLPTLLEYLGLPAPHSCEGAAVDLAAEPIGVRTERTFSQATKPWEQEHDPRWRNMPKSRCVRDGDYVFMQVPYKKLERLFNVAKDPAQKMNLLKKPAPGIEQIAARLRPRLEDWAASADPLPTEKARRRPQRTSERLKALGYL